MFSFKKTSLVILVTLVLGVLIAIVPGCASIKVSQKTTLDPISSSYERDGGLTAFDSSQIAENTRLMREMQKQKLDAELENQRIIASAEAEMIKAEAEMIKAEAEAFKNGLSGKTSFVRGVIINTSGHYVEIRTGADFSRKTAKPLRLCPKQMAELSIPVGQNVFVIDHLNNHMEIMKTETVKWKANAEKREVFFGNKWYDWDFYVR